MWGVGRIGVLAREGGKQEGLTKQWSAFPSVLELRPCLLGPGRPLRELFSVRDL